MNATINTEINTIVAGMVHTGYPPEEIPPEYELAGNALDSMAVTQLVIALGERFAIAFEDEELSPEDFATMATLPKLVERKLSSPD